MGYDVYLYKPDLTYPDADDASQIVEDDHDIWARKPYNYQNKILIEKALLQADISLEAFDYKQLAQKQDKSVEEVKVEFEKLELHSTDFGINIEIYDYHVAIVVPYIHQDDEAKKAFVRVNLYVNTITDVVRYFIYDPQTGDAFDPAISQFDGLLKYLSVSSERGTIDSSSKSIRNKRPWWKIW